MKRLSNPVLPVDYRKKEDRQVKDEELPLKPCLVCNKMTQGYGVFNGGVVCSKDHNTEYMNTRPKMIDYVIPKG